MNRKIFNFGLFLALGLTTAVFNSCNKDDDDGKGGSGENALKITATNVTNGSPQIKTVKVFARWGENALDYGYDVIAQAPYQNNGFTLELPATVGAKYLSSLLIEDVPQEISISNKNVKAFVIDGIGGYDEGENEIGYFYLGENDNSESNSTLWMYVDGDVTIRGEYTEIAEYYDEEFKLTFTQKFDLTLKKGWNTIYTSATLDDLSFTVTSKKPSGVNYTWNFESSSIASVATKSVENTKSIFSKLKENKRKR